MILKEKVKNLPVTPGVYLMKDSLNNVIYVGKAKNLKRRVSSYFQNSKSHTPKIEKLVKNLKDFDYILTETEFEAFMLECKLIKEIKPRYNRLMKSPLSYTYVCIKKNNNYPIIEISSSDENEEDNLYFGPYTSKNTVEKALNKLKDYFMINCTSLNKRNTVCLNHSLGLCIGMCANDTALSQYHKIIDKIIALMNGTDRNLVIELEQKMIKASMELNFESAVKYRDYLDSITFLISREKVIKFAEDYKNIIIFDTLDSNTFKLFIIKEHRIIYSEKLHLNNMSLDNITEIIKSHVSKLFNDSDLVSKKSISKNHIDEAQIIYTYLLGNSCTYISISKELFENNNNLALERILINLKSSSE
ncbi:MAG: GIY-YIG nuclease family protein [Clostridiaceae bacterium]